MIFAQELLNFISAGLVVWQLDDATDDTSLRLLYANSAAASFTGMALNERSGSMILEIFPDADRSRMKVYAEVCRLRRPADLGAILVGESVKKNTLSVRAFPVAERAVAVVLESLNSERRAEAEARKANRFLDSIVEHLPAMIFVKDADALCFERFNRAGEQLIGVSRNDLLGKSDYDFFPRDQADAFVNKDREVLQRGTLEDIPEEPIQTSAGTRWLHTRKIPILDEDGRARHLLGVSIDITEQKLARDSLEAAHASLARAVAQRTSELLRTEEQLRQAQKMEAVGRLAGGVAHDFNNLLSVILSYTSLALGDRSVGDTLKTELEEIKRAAERAAELTRQLLAFSRQQVLEPRIVDLNEVITRLDRMLRRLIGEDIELRTVTRSELGRVKVDPHQIEQVILNLVVNARDAMPSGGMLTVETADLDFDESYSQEHIGVKPGRYVMLAVTDTGVGMDRETQAHIFEPFFTTKALGKGTGLGLSTVFGIVNQSGGHVWVYSEPSKGASFKVYLPRTDTEEIRTESRPPAEHQEGTQTVLLVEDEEQVRRVVMSVLRRNGYNVLEASNPKEALRRAEEHPHPIHLLLTDIVMPHLSGPELARRVLLLRPQVRVICMSGYTDETVLNHGILEAGMAFLQKPLTPDALLRKLREVLTE